MSERDRTRRTTADGLPSQQGPTMGRRDWEQLPENPDPRTDLGYDPLDLEVFETEVDEKLMILPRDEEMVGEDAFVVATADSLADLDANR